MKAFAAVWMVLAVACSAAGGAPVSGEAPSTPQPSASAGVREVDVGGLKAALAGGVTLIDVRTPEEFAAGHVPGAKNVPLDAIGSRIDEVGVAGAEVYVICQSGRRSLAASQTLAAKGLKPINVLGGTAAWKAAGLPTE